MNELTGEARAASNHIDRVEDRVRAPTGDPQSGFGVYTRSSDPYGPMATLIRIWLLGRSFGKTGYVVKGGFFAVYNKNRYTHRTRVASTSRPPPDRAINTAIITSLYIAIQRYTLYSYTSLYAIQPLQHPSVEFMTSYVLTLG